MPDKLELVVFQYSAKTDPTFITQINSFINQDLRKVLGKISKVEKVNKDTKQKIKAVDSLIELDCNNFEQAFIFENGMRVDFFFDKNENKVVFFLSGRKKDEIPDEEILDLSKKLAFLFNFSTFSVKNLTKGVEVWRTLGKIDPSIYSATNFFYAASTSWINIYPPKNIRDTHYLSLPDEFYLNIPADHVEKLDNGSILVNVHKNFSADANEIIEKTKKIVNYYKDELTKVGVWGEIKWSPNWRELYKDKSPLISK
jgi:hypothetical protein